MHAVVVYESMYGNTHLIADAVADGIRAETGAEVTVTGVDGADAVLRGGCDLLVVGGPTHAHGMTRPASRAAAAGTAAEEGSGLTMDADAEGPGLREWFDALDAPPAPAAAFDTRADGPPAFTGRASKGIDKRLRKHGFTPIVHPESFLVTKQNQLVEHEVTHAREWGAQVARACGTS